MSLLRMPEKFSDRWPIGTVSILMVIKKMTKHNKDTQRITPPFTSSLSGFRG